MSGELPRRGRVWGRVGPSTPESWEPRVLPAAAAALPPPAALLLCLSVCLSSRVPCVRRHACSPDVGQGPPGSHALLCCLQPRQRLTRDQRAEEKSAAGVPWNQLAPREDGLFFPQENPSRLSRGSGWRRGQPTRWGRPPQGWVPHPRLALVDSF